MSTDRELLELAAKAAGVAGDILFSEPSGIPYVATAGGVWSPLTDDGDALRLAVKLNMIVDTNCGVTPATSARPHFFAGNALETHGSDPYAATRRAIVRAAAAIGGSLK